MIRNLKRTALRTVSAALTLAVTASAIPLQAYAEELIPDDVYIQEVTLTDEILTSDVFYLTAPNAQLSEGANERYYLRVGRGGDVLSAASVNVKIADLTAKYGEDYEIYVLDEDAEVDNPENNESLIEMMEGEEYAETPIVEEDEFNEMVSEDAALQQSAQQAVNDSIEYIEEAAGLTPAESADGSEKVSVDPLQQARAMFTGIEGEAQNVTASQDAFMEIQEIADVLTTAVVGANLKVDFDEGEVSKYIVIDIEDNSEGDGDRYFYLMLSDPSGTTTISSASSCALTIMDDEEQLPSEVSFGECTFNDAYDTLTVEIKRSGSINQIADVQLVSEGITAQIGRDFSAVDMSVAFPMGIDTRTIDIPICTDYITADAEFVLKLSNNVGANVVTAEKSIIIPNIIMPDEYTNEILASTEISNTVPGSAEYYAAENKRNLGTITLDKAISLNNPPGNSADSHYTGYNGMSENSWRMMWQGGDGWTRFWHNYKGSVGAEWKMSNYTAFEYAGAQVNWSKSSTCAHINVGFEGKWGYENSNARSLAHGAVYSSNNELSNTVTNVFSNITDPVYINIYNRGNCDDCNSLYVNSITPIKRPFVVKLIEADKLKFLQADGSYKTDDGTATYLAISGAENNDATQSVIHYAEETVTFMQTVGKNISTPYTYLKQLKTNDGFVFADFENNGSTQYTKQLTTKFINDNSTCDNKKMIKYYKNSQMKNSNANSGNEYGMYGEIELKPTFDYKNATVKVIVPANGNYGYLNISGTDRKISSSQEYTYHLGDTLQLSTKMYDEYSKVYEPVGFEVKYKKNKSDSKWVETKTVKYSDGKAYLDANQRLRYGYYEVTPIFQTKGNVITVRVAKSDLNNFDTTYGLFATTMVNSTTISGEEYKEYIVYNDVVASKIYSLTVKSTKANVYPVWKAINEKDSYSGEVFYHEADSNKANNVIVLSTETFEDTYDYYHSLSGSVLSRVFNMQTGEIDESTMTAHEGAIVAAGESFAVAGKDGSFKISSIRAVPGETIRYLVTVNGEILIKEKTLGSKQKASVQTITMSDGTSKKVNLISNNVGNQFINTENGSILSNIEVWVDDMNNAGCSIIVDPDTSITVRALCNSPEDYKKAVNNNGVVSEVNAKENMTGATFVVYGSDNNIKEEYQASYDSETYFATIPMEKIGPGDRLFIRVETDKAVSGMPGEKMVYSDAYTAYMFVQDATAEVPPIEASIQPVTNMSFIELPLLGDSGFNFDFPFVSVSAEKTDTGYRMSIGVSPLQIADKIKGSNITGYDDRTCIKDIFSIKHPFDTFKQGIKESANFIGGFTDIAEKSVDAAKQVTSAIGAPTWKFDVQFGAYFEFNYVEITNPTNGAIYTDTVFTGVGGYIGISGGVKLTWYTVLPVVYLPAYFGIEISAEMLGYFGAGTDPTKPLITYKDANNATVKYEDALGEFDMSIQMAAKVQVYVGIGLCGLLGLRGGGTVAVMGQYEPSEVQSDWGAQITFTAGIWIDLFLFSVPLQYTFPQINFGSFEEYANASMQVSNSINANADFTLRAPYSDGESEWVPSENNSSASTGNGMSNVLPGTPDLLAGFSETSNYTLVENAYEHPEVQLLKLSDGSVFMTFLDTDSSRAESERTVLKYAVYSNDKWSDPVVVADDGTADFQPSICEMDNSRVMITWLSSDPEKQISEEAEDYLTSLEVYTAVIDYDAETPVSEITRLTNDEYYDYLPVSAYDDVTGDRAVYFVKTASNGSAIDMSNSYTNDCVVVYMLWSDPENDGEGRWLFDYYYDDEVGSEEEKLELIEYWNGQRFLASPIPELGIDVPNISDFAVTTYNGLAVFAYTIDQDSSNDTSFDKELFVQFYDFETHKTYMPVRLSDDNVSDAIPQFVRVGSGEEAYTAVFWYRNEKEIAYVDITDLVRNGVDENGQILDEYMNKDGITTLDRIYSYVEVKSNDSQGNKSMADFKPVVDGENIYIVWTQTAEGKNEGDLCREVFATALIHPEEDVAEDAETTIGCAWANPYRLTYSYANTDEPAVVIDTNGNMMVLYNQYNQEITEDPEKPVVISDFKLKASYMEPCGCVDVENITVSDDTPVAGDTVTVEFEAVNNGLTYAAGYTIEVYAEKDGQSELIETIDTDANMVPGQVDNYMVEWTVPEGVEGYVISTDSYEKGGDWTNHSYAASEPFISRAEYEVTNVYVVQDGNNFNISYDVENTGNAESTNDDIYNVVLVGPYCDTFGCTEEECIFAEVPMGGIGVGETKSYTEKLDVPLHIFEKYGYVNCLAVAVDKDNKQLVDGEDIRLAVTEPLNLMLNGNEYPTEIIMSVGETINLDVSCTPASISNKLETVFASENSDVALIDGTTITANEVGSTIISGSSNTYGEVIPDIAVTVIDGSGYTVRNVDEGVIITEYIGDSADRIEVPATIDGKPVVGIDDFAFGLIDDEVVISVPDTLISEYIGDEAFMTYEIINSQIISISGGTTVNEVLRFWFNEVGLKDYTDEEIAQAVAGILSKVKNANGLSMREIIMHIMKNIDEFGFSQEHLDKLDLVLSCMSYDSVKLEGLADTAVQTYAASKLNLEYVVVENSLSGDVTLDGVVNLYDVIAIAQYIMDKEMYPLTDQAMTNGDVTHDGNLNLYDAVEIAKAIMAS